MLVLVVALQEVLALHLAGSGILGQVDLHEAKLWAGGGGGKEGGGWCVCVCVCVCRTRE